MVLFNELKNFIYLKLRFNFKNLKKNFTHFFSSDNNLI